jgi:23S rRNA pseudouridine1911/1915/1917 synthase
MYDPLVVYEGPAFLILYKPPGIHTVPLQNDEEGTLLHWCIERFPELGRVRGKKAVEGGMLHRLDRETRGLVLAARTQEAFDALSAQQEAGRIIKTYGAVVGPPAFVPPGFPPRPPELELNLTRASELLTAKANKAKKAKKEEESTDRSILSRGDFFSICGPGPFYIESAFRAYGPGRKAVRPCVSGTAYRTMLKTVKALDSGLLYAELSLTKGFRHQLRCHLAWIGLPIRGDGLYGGSGSGPLALKAQGLSFPDPLDGRLREFSLSPVYED